MRSISANADGDVVDEMVDPKNIADSEKRGIVTSDSPERVEAARQAAQSRQLDHIADESNVTALANAALPGAQYMQNLAVGKDAALEARQRLSGNNPLLNVAGNVVEFALGAKGVGAAFKGLVGVDRAAKVGTALGLSKNSSVLRKTGRMIAEDVAIESHLYTQQLLDHDAPFVAEDYARQVGVGLVMASPIIAGAAARAGAQAGVRAVQASGTTLPGMLSGAGDVFTAAAVLSPGSKFGGYARKAAAGHVSGRVLRRVMRKGKGRALGATDEVFEAQMKHLDDMDHAGGLTPERLDRMAPSKRRAYIEDFKAVADGNVDFLDEIAYGTVTKRTRAMGTKVSAVRNQILGVHKRFQGEGSPVKLSGVARDRVLTELNGMLPHVENAGMADARGAIQRGIVDGGGDPGAIHRSLMEARINARFRRGVSGGADIVDDRIRELLDDPKLWGARQAKKNAAMNAAADDLVQLWDDLGDLHIPRHLEDVSLNDALHLQKVQGSVSALRQSMNTLEQNGMLSRSQVRAIETKLVDADDVMAKGTQAYGDAIKINSARRAAAARLQKNADLSGVPTTQESFAAQKMEMVGETAGELMKLGGKTLDALLNPKALTLQARGVAALHSMPPEDKYEAFEEVQQELATLTGNPEYAMAKMAPMLDRGAAYDPAGTDLAGAKMVNTLYWLASEMPRPDSTFYGRGAPQPLSEVEEFLEKWMAAFDPVSAAYAHLAGEGTPGMVDAVRVTSPAMYAQINLQFAEALQTVDPLKADPNVVASIGQFMGGLDPIYTPDFIWELQSTFAQTASQDGVVRGGVNNMPNPSNPQDPRSGFTQAQRQAR